MESLDAIRKKQNVIYALQRKISILENCCEMIRKMLADKEYELQQKEYEILFET